MSINLGFFVVRQLQKKTSLVPILRQPRTGIPDERWRVPFTKIYLDCQSCLIIKRRLVMEGVGGLKNQNNGGSQKGKSNLPMDTKKQ